MLHWLSNQIKFIAGKMQDIAFYLEDNNKKCHFKCLSLSLKKRIITFIIIIFIIICITRISSNNNKADHNIPVVEVTTAKKRDMSYIIELPGLTVSKESVNIVAQISGQLLKTHIKDGQYIKKGDLLFELDDRSYKAQLQQLMANLEKDRVNLLYLEHELKRQEAMYKIGAVSKDTFQLTKSNYDAQLAIISSDLAAIENIKVQLGYCKILSPVNGYAGKILIDEGNIVQNNPNNPLLLINEIDSYYIDFSVPERFLTTLQDAFSKSNLEIVVKTESNQNIKNAKVIFIDNHIDAQTGTIALRAIVENQNNNIISGQYLRIFLSLYKVRNALTIPISAIQMNQNGKYVYTALHDKAVIRPVIIDFMDDNYAVVEKGLTENELVITNGQFKLSPGIKLKVKSNMEDK